MIDISQYAKLIETEINNIDTQTTFVIHSQVGNYEKAVRQSNGQLKYLVNGILTLTMGSFTPVEDIENLSSHYLLEFIVKQEDKDKVNDILSTWAKAQIGVVQSIEDTNFLITPSIPETGAAKNVSIGAAVSMRMTIEVQSIERGLLSNMVHWKIDGKEIKVESASFTSQRTSENMPPVNEAVIFTENSWSATTITMVIPYSFKGSTSNSDNVIMRLARNILEDKKDERFSITRNDGRIETTHEYILMQGSIMEQSERIVALNCTFMRTTQWNNMN